MSTSVSHGVVVTSSIMSPRRLWWWARLVSSALVCLALLNGPYAHAVGPTDTKHPKQLVSGDFFMEACTVVGETAHGMIPHFDCESYIYGVLDALSLSRSLPCLPKQLAPWQVYEALLSSSPSSAARQHHAAALIVSALGKKYPCK